MLTLSENGTFLTAIAKGKLTRDDFARFVPMFEDLATRWGKVPILIDATRFESWEGLAIWDDLKFDATHQEALGPMAVIGDAMWEEWATGLSKPFFSAPLRFFRPDEIETARAWLIDATAAERS